VDIYTFLDNQKNQHIERGEVNKIAASQRGKKTALKKGPRIGRESTPPGKKRPRAKSRTRGGGETKKKMQKGEELLIKGRGERWESSKREVQGKSRPGQTHTHRRGRDEGGQELLACWGVSAQRAQPALQKGARDRIKVKVFEKRISVPKKGMVFEKKRIILQRVEFQSRNQTENETIRGVSRWELGDMRETPGNSPKLLYKKFHPGEGGRGRT